MSFFNNPSDQDQEYPNFYYGDEYQIEPSSLMDRIQANESNQQNNDGDEIPLSYDYLSQEEKSLYNQFVSAGFNMENTNLKIIQIINSMQLQMEVFEKVIFTNSDSSIFQYDIDFNLEETPSRRNSTECQTGTDLSEEKQKNCYKLSGNGVQEEKIVDTCEWQDVNQTTKQKFLMFRQQISELKSVITQSFTAQQGNDYICMICSAKFDNGRKLGGHISRKHPGNTLDYNKKKAAQENKVIEKKRRLYFKNMNSSSEKSKPIAKQPKNKGKRNKNISAYQQQ